MCTLDFCMLSDGAAPRVRAACIYHTIHNCHAVFITHPKDGTRASICIARVAIANVSNSY